MTRRWQADGIPFWRKLFSSNWWWYGEVNPDLASLPSPENSPKFWRGEVIYVAFLLVGSPLIIQLSAELNSRYWFFNQNDQYIGKIVDLKYSHPQLQVELTNGVILNMAFPFVDALGMPRKKKDKPIEIWRKTVDKLSTSSATCPDSLLLFEAEKWKFTFDPYLTVWEVRCARDETSIVTREQIHLGWRYDQRSMMEFSSLFVIGIVFFVFLIIRRERKRYVKS